MSTDIQHVWAWVFTAIVALLAGAGVSFAIYMRAVNYRSKRHIWASITQRIDPPFNPYPERPIDPERYRMSDRDLQAVKRLREMADDDPTRLSYLNWQQQTHEVKHIDGVCWNEAELPPVNHVCWPQTDGWIMFRQVQRCACGAIRESDDPEWSRINERKRKS